MGGSSFDYGQYTTYTKSKTTATRDELFTSSQLLDEVNPAKIKNGYREACDSTDNPNSTPVIISLDATGSMGFIPEYMVRTGLGELFKNIYDHKPVSDPQVLFSIYGDVIAGDPAPFGVGQFESQADLLTAGLEKFWLGGCRGGGNGFETGSLAYYFALNKTKTDAFTKRGQKGFLITIGDEPPETSLSIANIKKVFGDEIESDITFVQMIEQVSRTWIPIHIIIEEGSHVRGYGLDAVKGPWTELLGPNAIVCSDHTKLAEVIVAVMEVKSGKDVNTVINNWDGSTKVAIAKAIGSLSTVGNDTTSIVF